MAAAYSLLLMRPALRAIAAVVVVTLVAAACGTTNETSTPDPVAIPATATPTPVITPTEMAPADTPIPEPTPYLHQSGLACYEERSVGWTYNFDPDHVVGFPTVDEAAAHWWHNESEAHWWHSRDGTDTISAEDLTQHPSQDNTVAFRDTKGNTPSRWLCLRLSVKG